jgi:hypothetical protein
MKLGLKPFVPDHRDLMFAKYRTAEPLPQHPATFGHEGLITDWMMLGNDQVGDCVVAGGGHETMLWTAMGGNPAIFTTESVLSDYSAITGYDPNQIDANGNNPTDQGTDMREAAKYRQQTGLIDAQGNRHKIGAFLFIDPQNYDQFLEAVWLFGAVGMGINVPQSAQDQFAAGQPWHVVPIFDWNGRKILGGHYIPAVADRATPVIITWGKTQLVTSDFIAKYCTAIVAYISLESLTAGKSLEGFDLAALQSDLNQLQQAS